MEETGNTDDFSSGDAQKLKIFIVLLFTCAAFCTGSVANVILILIEEYHTPIIYGSVLPIARYGVCALGGFFLSPYVARIVYRSSILIGLFGTIISSIIMLVKPGFVSSVCFFAILGIDYTLIKTSIFSLVKLIIHNKKEHTGFFSLLESLYMFGILAEFWIFSFFIKLGSWLYIYIFFSLLAVILIVFCQTIKIPELKNNTKSDKKDESLLKTLYLFRKPAVYLFAITLIAYIMLEKGIADWLPTFNRLIFHLSMHVSIKIASLFGAFLALGRLFFSLIIRYIDSDLVLVIFVGIVFIIVLMLGLNDDITAGVLIESWKDVPLVAYVLPLTGFFIGPVCPVLYSSILLLFNDKNQSRVSGIIITVSGTGSILGSISMGYFIQRLSKTIVCEFLAATIAFLLICMIPYFMQFRKVLNRELSRVENNPKFCS